MKNNIVLWGITGLITLVFLEILLSAFLLHTYRAKIGGIDEERSRFSTVNAIYLAMNRLGAKSPQLDNQYTFRRTTLPTTFNIEDVALGYKSKPGKYERIYQRKLYNNLEWESLKTHVTINNDGTRWVGEMSNDNSIALERPHTKRLIHVYGDSFVFGIGVNDEHTFSYLAQQHYKNSSVKLFALGGYSLTQALISFDRHKGSLSKNDIVILGYADFYNDRHVLSPSHLLGKQKWFAKHNPVLLDRNFRLPKVVLNETGHPKIEYIYENCNQNQNYCDQPSPTPTEMTNVSAAIINYIEEQTEAKVYLLHLRGPKDDPIFDQISDSISVISVTKDDFDYFVSDDAEGFDKHPGPYWHHAVSRKIINTITRYQAPTQRMK